MKKNSLETKLHPGRFTAMSSKMAAIASYVLGIGDRWAKPAITGMMVTSDGYVMASLEGDLGYNAFIGSRTDLVSNWLRLLDAAGLTKAERARANKLFGQSFPSLKDML